VQGADNRSMRERLTIARESAKLDDAEPRVRVSSHSGSDASTGGTLGSSDPTVEVPAQRVAQLLVTATRERCHHLVWIPPPRPFCLNVATAGALLLYDRHRGWALQEAAA
jgi:hypothetical protein